MQQNDDIPDEYITQSHLIIGRNVKKIREEKGISQLELAHKIGHKSVSIISCAELHHKGDRFNIEHLLKIAFALDVDVKIFFDGIDTIINSKE